MLNMPVTLRPFTVEQASIEELVMTLVTDRLETPTELNCDTIELCNK